MGPGPTAAGQGGRHRLEQEGLPYSTPVPTTHYPLPTTHYYPLLPITHQPLPTLARGHGANPNPSPKQEEGTLWLVATEEIARGQEIRFDYESGKRGAC